MDFSQIAQHMFQYWCLGIFMIFAVLRSSHKDIIRISWPDVAYWVKMLGIITIMRVIYWQTPWGAIQLREAYEATNFLPWQAIFFVFWEDMAHTVPLALIQRWIGTEKWTWPIHGTLILAAMFYFGIGHLYQGLGAALQISLYVPVTMWIGKNKGFGTVMICHILFDLSTIGMIQLMTRLM